MTGNIPDGLQLSRKQEVALDALVSSHSQKEAAEKAKVGERTLRRWLADDAFLTAYRERSREVSGRAMDALRDAQQEAVMVLRKGLIAESATVRIRAASRLLELHLKARESDFEERLAEVERIADEWQLERRADEWQV